MNPTLKAMADSILPENIASQIRKTEGEIGEVRRKLDHLTYIRPNSELDQYRRELETLYEYLTHLKVRLD